MEIKSPYMGAMGRVKGMLSSLQERIDGFFYKCEYLKECDKVTPQCRHGGNSYCGEYKKRVNKKAYWSSVRV
jgi:hypothetical protein